MKNLEYIVWIVLIFRNTCHIGQTDRKFSTRIKEHNRGTSKSESSSSQNSSDPNNNVQFLHLCKKSSKLEIDEAF